MRKLPLLFALAACSSSDPAAPSGAPPAAAQQPAVQQPAAAQQPAVQQPAAQRQVPAPGSAALENLRFLAGTWRGEREGRWIEEIWSEPAGNSQLGIARVLEGQEVRDYEAAILHQSEDMLVLHLRHFGAVADRLEARGPTTPFRLVRHGKAEAIFEAMGEDEVRRITYRRDGDRLTVELERRKGEPLQWRYERVR